MGKLCSDELLKFVLFEAGGRRKTKKPFSLRCLFEWDRPAEVFAIELCLSDSMNISFLFLIKMLRFRQPPWKVLCCKKPVAANNQL